MPVPELQRSKPTPIEIYTGVAGGILFVLNDMFGKDFLKMQQIGILLHFIIGFVVGYIFGKMISSVKKQIDEDKRNSKINRYGHSAQNKYQKNDYNGAIEETLAALVINKTDASLHFNLACLYSLRKDEAKAFEHLSFAGKYKYNDLYNKIMKNSDLNYIKGLLKFDDFISNEKRLNRLS